MVIENKDTSPSDREAAQARVAERNEELERLAPQVAEREKGKPLRERIKEIIKKHGFTVVAVVAAVSITIKTLISKLTSGIKSVTKDIKDGIKTLGDKISSILPGLLGAIVKFVFDTSGKVISFPGEHAWLLILAVRPSCLKRLSSVNPSKV